MKCSRCQHENRAGAKFCSECAHPAGQPAPSTTLVTTGGAGETIQCGACRGQDLKGYDARRAGRRSSGSGFVAAGSGARLLRDALGEVGPETLDELDGRSTHEAFPQH
ncbi:MAG: zinc-ribbon domain-containing protein [Candidatus Rokuibacteriota bacterium]